MVTSNATQIISSCIFLFCLLYGRRMLLSLRGLHTWTSGSSPATGCPLKPRFLVSHSGIVMSATMPCCCGSSETHLCWKKAMAILVRPLERLTGTGPITSRTGQGVSICLLSAALLGYVHRAHSVVELGPTTSMGSMGVWSTARGAL